MCDFTVRFSHIFKFRIKSVNVHTSLKKSAQLYSRRKLAVRETRSDRKRFSCFDVCCFSTFKFRCSMLQDLESTEWFQYENVEWRQASMMMLEEETVGILLSHKFSSGTHFRTFNLQLKLVRTNLFSNFRGPQNKITVRFEGLKAKRKCHTLNLAHFSKVRKYENKYRMKICDFTVNCFENDGVHSNKKTKKREKDWKEEVVLKKCDCHWDYWWKIFALLWLSPQFCKNNPRSRKRGLKDFLIEPVQHLQRFLLVLRVSANE